jgi:alkylation response protein AidB-like acyl-CoA dehydrogenase
MDFQLDSDDAMVAQTVRAYAQDVLVPRAAERDQTARFPDIELHELAAMGLLGVTVPEHFGGSGMSASSLAEAIAAIAEADASVAVTAAVTNMVAEILAKHAQSEVAARVLPELCAGKLGPAAFALSEAGAGSDPAGMRTTFAPATRDGVAGYEITGSKLWITSGDKAGALIVMARRGTEGRDYTAFLVAGGTPGLSVGNHEHKMGQRGSSTVPLILDQVFVPETQVVGVVGQGFKVALEALDGGRINVAAMAVGIARAALAAAVKYARDRVQFGQPIAANQAIQFMLADAATRIDAAWLLVQRAAWFKASGQPVTLAAAQAKLFATETAVSVCDAALQIHGGYGYTREFPVERYYRDVRVTTIYEGTSQIQKIVIARHMLKTAASTIAH